MRSPYWLIWLTFLVLGFAIAAPVSEQGHLDGLNEADQTSSGQYDPNALKDFFDQPSAIPPSSDALSTSPSLTSPLSTSWTSGSGNFINQRLVDETKPISTKSQLSADTSSGSTFLAQNAYGNDIPVVSPAIKWLGGAAAAGWGLLNSLGQDVRPVPQDDHSNIEGTNTPSKDDKTQPGGAGATPQPAADTSELDPANPCPVELYARRTMAWCDSGFRGSVRVSRGNVLVWGYPFSGSCRDRAYQLYWCCSGRVPYTATASDCMPVNPISQRLVTDLATGRW